MVDYRMRPALEDDIDVIAELRAVVLRDDLQRLGRYDEVRVRQRFRDGFVAAHTTIIEVGGRVIGSIAVRPGAGCHWIEHFYVATALQRCGIGSAVLAAHIAAADAHGVTLRLDVLQGSPARALYERHGFVVEREDELDVFMVRTAAAGAV